MIERKAKTDVHVIYTSKGKSLGFQAMEDPHILEIDSDTRRVSLGSAFGFGQEARALKGQVYIGDALSLKRSLAGTAMLVKDGRILRIGRGTRGQPYLYKFGVPASAREQ